MWAQRALVADGSVTWLLRQVRGVEDGPFWGLKLGSIWKSREGHPAVPFWKDIKHKTHHWEFSESSAVDLVKEVTGVSVEATAAIRIQSLGWRDEEKVTGYRGHKGQIGWGRFRVGRACVRVCNCELIEFLVPPSGRDGESVRAWTTSNLDPDIHAEFVWTT